MKILNLAISVWLAVAGIGQSLIAPHAPVVCPSIQPLINGMADGGTIFLNACTFYESLTIDKNLSIIGDSSGNTIFYPSAAGSRIITLTGSHTLNLQYLTLRNGSPTDGNGGGAILASEGSLQISHSTIYNNSATDGGGIYQGNSSGTVYLTNDLIENNSATNGQGGGVFANGTVISTNTTFNTNSASMYGGAISIWSGDGTFNGGYFTSNTAAGNGGAININNGLDVTGVIFTSNTSGDSGGAILQWNANVTTTINQSDFHSNQAKNKGGGVYTNSIVSLNGDWFDSNIVDTASTANSYGGGVYAGNSGSIYLSPAVTLQNTKFTLNEAKCTGSCFAFGGGMYVDNPMNGASLTLTVMSTTTFDGNKAWMGGGVYANNGQVNMDHSTISNNQAGYGAGIYPTIVQGEAVLFSGNQASVIGGGIRAGKVSLKNSKFIQNTAGYAGGGAISVSQTISLTNILLAGNTQTSYGTIQTELSASGTITNVTIAQPSLWAGTAIYLVASSNVTISNSIIANYAKCYDIAGTLTEDHMFYSNDTQQEIVESGGTFHNNGYNLAFDAQFVSPAAGDYHLKSTSPAIAGGLYTSGVDVDLDYRPRRAGHSAMGAYNFWRLTFQPILKK